jgi:hypothetical protein
VILGWDQAADEDPLRQLDEPSVTLELDGYQGPSDLLRDPHGRNWLWVCGTVYTPSGDWSFRDPCLLTWETPEISAWLRAVVDGRVEPEHADGLPDLDFLEPNISLGLESYSDDSARIRLHFSAECVPPWADADENDYVVVVTASFEELLRAAAEWDSESAAFPRR